MGLKSSIFPIVVLCVSFIIFFHRPIYAYSVDADGNYLCDNFENSTTVSIATIKDLLENDSHSPIIYDLQLFITNQVGTIITFKEMYKLMLNLLYAIEFSNDQLFTLKMAMLTDFILEIPAEKLYGHPNYKIIIQKLLTSSPFREENLLRYPKMTLRAGSDEVLAQEELRQRLVHSFALIAQKFPKAKLIDVSLPTQADFRPFQDFWVKERENLYYELSRIQKTDAVFTYSIQHIQSTKFSNFSILSTDPSRFYLLMSPYIQSIGKNSNTKIMPILGLPSGKPKSLSLRLIPDSKQLFKMIKEFEIMDQLKHIPQVVTIFDKGFAIIENKTRRKTQVGGVIVSELLDGNLNSLASIYQNLDELTKDHLLRAYLRDVGNGMLEIHKSGIVINGLNFENIYFKNKNGLFSFKIFPTDCENRASKHYKSFEQGKYYDNFTFISNILLLFNGHRYTAALPLLGLLKEFNNGENVLLTKVTLDKIIQEYFE